MGAGTKAGDFFIKIGLNNKNMKENVMTLPNKLGKKLGYGAERSVHQGPHAQYTESVIKLISSIELKYSGKLSKQQMEMARKEVTDLMINLKKELKEGSIKLVKDESLLSQKQIEDLKKWTAAMSIFASSSISVDAAENEVINEMDKDFEKLVESRHKYVKYGLARTYLGEDNNFIGWTGFVIDFVNPVDLVTGVSEIELQLELIVESQDKNDPILKIFYKTPGGQALQSLITLRHMGKNKE